MLSEGECLMLQRTPNSAALDFLSEWDECQTPSVKDYKDYLATCMGDAGEMLDLVADCIIFEALASPGKQWAPRKNI
jgi:hypothetical protein